MHCSSHSFVILSFILFFFLSFSFLFFCNGCDYLLVAEAETSYKSLVVMNSVSQLKRFMARPSYNLHLTNFV
jgi:hypothetical protein